MKIPSIMGWHADAVGRLVPIPANEVVGKGGARRSTEKSGSLAPVRSQCTGKGVSLQTWNCARSKVKHTTQLKVPE